MVKRKLVDSGVVRYWCRNPRFLWWEFGPFSDVKVWFARRPSNYTPNAYGFKALQNKTPKWLK